MRFICLLLASFFFYPCPLLAASGGIPGEALSLWWALPFCGMLASLALMPLFATHVWEAHYGKIALGWSLITILALWSVFGISSAMAEIQKTFFHEYLPFVIMIGSLYTISGGIHIDVEAHATPAMNTCLLAIATLVAGWMGTTGASMLFIRPLLHMNRDRKYRVHHIIFFIFLVANIGGILTPLGDPPLFLGFLNGISFFWPIRFLFWTFIGITLPLLFIFYLMDAFFVRRENLHFHHSQPRVIVKGSINGAFLFGVMGLVLLSGMWKPGIEITLGNTSLELQNIMRDGGLVLLAVISWLLTPKGLHEMNHFSWEPLKEVVKLFFGIFITVTPIILILDVGLQGALASLISLVDNAGQTQNIRYFWLTGILSSFLDNAPTYLVFFHIAGGDAKLLMTSLSQTLAAISLGSVFMGAMTYIGNAPNFMVKTIAERHKIPMPHFFGYMAWSLGILLPLFILLSWWWF